MGHVTVGGVDMKRVKRDVVRCKDCKFRDGDYCLNKEGFAYWTAFFTRDDDYCSRGKVRREYK